MIIFVTGSTGFVGRRFQRKLLARLATTDRVYALEREPAHHTDPRIVPRAGDRRAIGAHATALREAHWVFHLAADAAFGAGTRYEEINLRPVQALIALLHDSVALLGTLHLTHLLKSSLVRDGATIANIASSVAYHPLPGMSVYAASKAFIQSWSLALGEELRGTNRVVTFSPSGTRTNFQKSGGVGGREDPGLLEPAQVARELIVAARRRTRHRLLSAKSRALVFVSHGLPDGLKLRLRHRLFAATR